MVRRTIVALTIATFVVVGGVASSAPKKSPRAPSATTCWADPGSVSMGSGYVLHATGLPTDKALNISISNAEGDVVYPFGMSITGTEAFQETASIRGTTTYTFMGEIRGNTRIYGMCSVEVV